MPDSRSMTTKTLMSLIRPHRSPPPDPPPPPRAAHPPRPSVTDILSRPAAAAAAAEGPKSRLETLPAELLFQVVSHLRLESQACLAACNRTLALKLGMQRLLAVRRTRNSRNNRALVRYLQLLQRDRPSLYFCNQGLKLHHVDGEDHLRPEEECMRPEEEPVKIEWVVGRDNSAHFVRWDKSVGPGRMMEYFVSLGGGETPYLVAFYHIQLAKAHQSLRENPTDDRLPRLCYLMDQSHNTETNEKLFDIETRLLSSGRVLARSQHLLEVDPTSNHSVNLAASALEGILCGHYTWPNTQNPLQYTFPIRRRVIACALKGGDHNTSKRCPTCDFVALCPGCPTEWTVERVQISATTTTPTATNTILVITQWKDMGKANDPADPLWRAHVAPNARNQIYPVEFTRWAWAQRPWKVGRIRQRFEGGRGVALEALTAANLARLARGQERLQERLQAPLVPLLSRRVKVKQMLASVQSLWSGHQDLV